jgi:hypothetical protein
MSRRGIWPALLLAGAGLLLLAFAVPNLAPAIRAARDEGVRGTFTAERLACVQHPGHEQCTWYGTFHSPGNTREVTLYGAGRGTVHEGERVPAVDVAGRPLRVYPPSGSREWIVVATVLAVACGLLALATRRFSHLSRAGRVRL